VSDKVKMLIALVALVLGMLACGPTSWDMPADQMTPWPTSAPVALGSGG
jgi:hypothetical protein